jgi:hypothetical protein
MTNLRSGLGSCTPNWGTHDDRDFRDFPLGQRPRRSRCGTRRTPLGWIGPQAGDRRTNIEPKGIRPRLHQHDWATRQRLSRPDDRVQTN